jgi:hypothetical protein
MRRICVLLSFVALRATTLALATSEPHHRRRSDVRIGFRPELGLLSSASNGPVTFSPPSGQDRACCVVLLDGSDRWRSLLLGAPPLFA